MFFLLTMMYFGEGNGNPLQCSCLENPRDGGAWWATVYGVAQSQTRLKWLSSSSSMLLDILQCCTDYCSTVLDSQNWVQQGTRICAIDVRRVWNCSLPSISFWGWWSLSSNVFRLFSLFQLVSACSLDAGPCMPVIILYYCTFCTVRFKMFSFFVFVICSLSEKYYKPIMV